MYVEQALAVLDKFGWYESVFVAGHSMVILQHTSFVGRAGLSGLSEAAPPPGTNKLTC